MVMHRTQIIENWSRVATFLYEKRNYGIFELFASIHQGSEAHFFYTGMDY